jgi:amino acid adenylation domain-containing protein
VQEQIRNQISPVDAAAVSAAKRDLLARFLRGDIQPELSQAAAIARRRSDVAAQLSFSQERLWFLDQLMPGSPVFNVPMAVRISRPLDLNFLQQSVSEIVRRHEVFRTAFVTSDGVPRPVISSDARVTLKLIDLSAVDPSLREAEAQHLAREEALRPFDLTRAPLIRATVVRLDDRVSIFLLTMHHIVSDGTSILIFFRELSALYQALANGQSSPLAEQAIQYSDYANWQRDWLREELTGNQLGYWKQKLGGELPVLEIPTDRPRPVIQTHSGARVTLALSEDLTRSLNALSQSSGTTLFMTLLAGFKALLHRYSGQEDIIVGSPISNRPRIETEKLIGFFLNNLALRTDISGEPTFRDLLARVRQTALDGYSNQDVPFEKLLEELKPERDLSRTSIFQVYFNLFSFSDRIDVPDGESISFVDAWLQSEEMLAKFDLTLYAGAGEREIKLALVYNTDLFSQARMQEMLAQLEQLLRQAVTNPDEKISSYSLVTPEAKWRLPNPMHSFTAQRDRAITEWLSEQAERRPHTLAVCDSATSWSYADLDRRSNQLANHLRGNGIQKGDIVAIYGHRSASLVWAILGVLKAAAVFTILDPAYPAPRLIDCLRIANPRGWIQIEAAGALAPDLKDFIDNSNQCRLNLGPQTDFGNLVSDENPNIQITPDDLAYIAFTSGSTGQPKGVMGRHGPLTLFTSWAIDRFQLNEHDRFCMVSGLAHDPLHRDIFTPLQLGGTICIPDSQDLEAPDRLRAWMKQQEVTIANLTPAMSQVLTEDNAGDQLLSLRYSFLVGDVLTKRDVARLKQLAPSITCVNLYGSTETQRAVGHYVASGPDRAGSWEKEVLPLGKGIRDVQLLVLNQRRALCGIGEVGEICFRSPYLAKGYLGDEELTRERFIRSPFTQQPDDRFYRTGDLGRYLPDGNVEHVGRADRQVKIRGFRIELGEIEAALAKHPAVSEAVVILSDSRLQPMLIAYVVPDQEKLIDAQMLRGYLSEKLPQYMIPSAFVMLESLPLTPNRKLDRRALPAPDQIKSEVNTYVAARSPTEKTLTAIWQEVLEKEAIGVCDNFFELGGHSLLAVRLFGLIQKRFDARLPLATLFRAPTIAQLAAVLETDSSQAWSSLVPIQPRGTRPPLFCIHAVGGNVLEYYDLARYLGDDQPFYGLQAYGLDGHHAPHARIEDMAAHYVKEIREFQPDGPYFLGGRSLGGVIAYEMSCQLRAQGAEVRLLALLDSYPVGHEKLAPEAGTAIGKLKRGFRRVRTHISNLRGLSARHKLLYLAGKSQYAPVRVKSKLWRTIYRWHQKIGREIPPTLRKVEQFNWLAAGEFIPRVYDGPVTLFWASSDLRGKFDMLEGWRTLAPSGLTVQEVSGTHLNIIKEPYVAELAQTLSEHLAHALMISC